MPCGVKGGRVVGIQGVSLWYDRRVSLVCSEPPGHKGRHYDETFSLEFGKGLGVADDDAEAA
jgi:hypothetical protein